jgi:hypothetical protein
MNRPPLPIAVVHGRFQPLHLGHMEYLLAGAERCRTLIVGITNPDPWHVKLEPTDPARGNTNALWPSPAAAYPAAIIRGISTEGRLLAWSSSQERTSGRVPPTQRAWPQCPRCAAIGVLGRSPARNEGTGQHDGPRSGPAGPGVPVVFRLCHVSAVCRGRGAQPCKRGCRRQHGYAPRFFGGGSWSS